MNGIFNFMWGLRKMNRIDKSVLLFSKEDEWCKKCFIYLKERFKTVIWWTGRWGDDHGWDHGHWKTTKFDYVISYLFPAVLPKTILDLAKEHAINFHPAPPKYPGIGGYNYAIWNGDLTYGVTCHEMEEKVDSGHIYYVNKFFIRDHGSSVKSLKEYSMVVMFEMFKDVIKELIDTKTLDKYRTKEMKWYPTLYTREMFQKACKIDLYDVDAGWTVLTQKDYIKRKVRAYYFPGARDYPYFLIDGKKYKVTPVDDE